MPSKLQEALDNNPHLEEYLNEIEEERGERPEFREYLSRDMASMDEVDIVYPVNDPVFIHLDIPRNEKGKYWTIEPPLKVGLEDKIEEIRRKVLRKASRSPTPEEGEGFEEKLNRLIDEVISKKKGTFAFSISEDKVRIDPEDMDSVRYYIKKRVMGYDLLEPLLYDPYIEDIHCVALNNLSVLHEVFGLLETDLSFKSEERLEKYVRSMSNRMGKNVTESNPIADGALPMGSRVNIVYSKDVSKEGPSFTIRNFSEEPITISQIIDWNTLSPKMAAYLWLALEFDMSIIVSGVTASGKTTTMNSLLPFIGYDQKIYTAEDTPEVNVPQPTWQRLITRETGPKDSRVELFDLVKTALRSRPDYIIVGEVRGREGSAAFQAIQTGHPVMSTFHASSIDKLIQRFTGDPINVPIRFMDNLNVCLFQQIIYHEGQILRRCSSVVEILSYSREKEGVQTRQIFTWDPINDEHDFIGMNNSYVLENLVAPKLRYDDRKKIYDELERRTQVLKEMADVGITKHEDVAEIFKSYSYGGMENMRNTLAELKREGGFT
ncbi:MAG: type II/IV secretion system ATPase subunit [Candidatus Thermoplasmatota archaeon]|nr:type II/IV secretion system ATPase subunit [Candidatus Thermoplasmatota archaeon]